MTARWTDIELLAPENLPVTEQEDEAFRALPWLMAAAEEMAEGVEGVEGAQGEAVQRAVQQKMEAAFGAAPARTITAPDILRAGLAHMEDRAATYDQPRGERSMQKTVGAFNALTGAAITEEQGWLFMVCLKAARTQQGAFRADNFEDGAAYFGLMGEAAAKGRA